VRILVEAKYLEDARSMKLTPRSLHPDVRRYLAERHETYVLECLERAQMTLSLEERLNQILPRITSRDFLDSKGLGNEIGFWIFDYPPEREVDVRDFSDEAPCCPRCPSSNRRCVPANGQPVELW
jgi:hypothetical protein